MSLLVDMTGVALDPAYAEQASRGTPRAAGSFRRSLVVLVLVGLVTGVAAVQVRQQGDQLDAARQRLLTDVRNQTRLTNVLAGQADQWQATVSHTRQQVLGADAQGRAVASQLDSLELQTGLVPVSGPGVEVSLDDAPASNQSAQQGEGRIYDRDLQDVTNALWAAGAEAIAINGQRLTAQSAIRTAGEAILVDLQPLAPPYLIDAVGDPNTLEPRFVDGATARRFQTWTSLYGIGFQVHREGTLTLPAAPMPDLAAAHPGGPS
jgi:uncharacterized protein YlxW (UPF0749 family)